jgi:hypothetical protein
MAEDVVSLVAGKPPLRGRSSFEQGLRALFSEHRIESTGEVQETEVSGDLAYCWANLTSGCPSRGRRCDGAHRKFAVDSAPAIYRFMGCCARRQSVGPRLVTDNPFIENTGDGNPGC